MVRPTLAKTFSQYVSLHIIPFLESQISDSTQRLDAVWDTYPDENLKALTQQKRGYGARVRVGNSSAPIPRHEWNEMADIHAFVKDYFGGREYHSLTRETF